MKIYFTYDKKEREGFHVRDLSLIRADEVYNNEVEEIAGEGILEKIPNLIDFIEECHKLLKPEGTATFTAAHADSTQAWSDPRNIRGITQMSLNFADKTWREQNGVLLDLNCNFEVGCNFAIDLQAAQRSEEAKNFWLSRYNNVIQSVMFTLKKR